MKGVSAELYEWVSAHKGHPDPAFNPKSHYSCFLKTEELLYVRGNAINANGKYDIALERLRTEPLTMESPPILALDCVSGDAKLVEGNNRLAAFHTLGYEWFPVVVVITSTPGAQLVRPIPDEFTGMNDYDHARYWRYHEAEVLAKVYAFEEYTPI